jgi:hypothetical protein
MLLQWMMRLSFTLSGNNSSYTENGSPVIVDGGLTVSDVDNTNLQSAVITITNLQAGDALLYTNQLGITGSYNSSTGTLTLIGDASLAHYQTALRSVAYRNTLDNPDITPRNIRFVVNDGTLDSAEASATVNVIAVNDAPALISGVTLATVQQDSSSPSGAVGTSVDTMIANLGVAYSDPDGTGVPKGIAITAADVTHGVWYYSTTGGTTWSNLGSPSTALSRLLAADGSGQNRIYFQPAASYHGATSLTFRAWDQTSGTNGGTADTSVTGGVSAFSTNSQVASLTVAAAPVVVLSGGSRSYTENASPVVIDSGLTVSDIDSANLRSAIVTIINLQTGDELLFSNQLGITGSYNAGTGVLTLSGSASPSNYQTALRSVTYRNTLDNPDATPRQISVAVNDGDLSSAAVTKTVNVIAVNDAPTLIDAAGTVSYTGNVEVVQIDSTLVIGDVDNSNLQGARVSLVENFKADQDILVFFIQNGISGFYNSSVGVLTLSGSSSIANYQAALRSVAYQNSASSPDRSKRGVEFKVYDGADWSGPIQREITFTALPTNPTADTSQSTWEDIKNRVLIAAPSVAGGVALSAFGLWANRRMIATSWAAKEYQIANLLRQKLNLSLGRAASESGFISEVNELVDRLKNEHRCDLLQMMKDNPENVENIMQTVADTLRNDCGIQWDKARLCYNLFPDPLCCWPKYEFRQNMIHHNLSVITAAVMAMSTNVEGSQERLAGAAGASTSNMELANLGPRS